MSDDGILVFLMFFKGAMWWFVGGGGAVLYCRTGFGFVVETCSEAVMAANMASGFAAGCFGLLLFLGFSMVNE